MRIQEFDYNSDLQKVLLWQYQNSENLQELIARQQIWLDENQTQFWEDWYNDFFNLQTANSSGLIVWSIILGLPLFVEVSPDSPNKHIFGFNPFYFNFNNGVFTSEQQNALSLTLEERRLVLNLRYFQMTTRGGLVEINQNLERIFKPFGLVYVIDNYAVTNSDFTIEYFFNYTPSQKLLNVLEIFDLLPRPATIKIKNVNIP